MPVSLQIGLLVLGGVLILIGLLGGNFKLFGTEVAATISNPLLRFVSFIFGTILLILAVQSPKTVDLPPPTPNPTPTISSTPTPNPIPTISSTPTPNPTPTISSTPTPNPTPSISGIWYDSTLGHTSKIIQNKDGFQFTTTGTLMGYPFNSSGSGTISGKRFNYDYNTQYQSGKQSNGKCSGTISDDGMHSSATCKDSILGTFVTSADRQ